MKKVVTIGGGTGTFVVLSALKNIENLSLSAVVSGADNGGSTGRLRDAYGILPVGDARQALVALAENESLRELFSYRFSKGDVAGHNLGNLLLTALADITGNEYEALRVASNILRVRGEVFVASDTPATLVARYADGSEVVGENSIDERTSKRSRIQSVFLNPSVTAGTHTLEALREADVIILGPGDLYTSTAAALCAEGIREEIQKSNARLVYVLNLFSKAGQTQGMKASDLIQEVAVYAGRMPDDILVNTDSFPDTVLEHYASEGEEPVQDDLKEVEGVCIHRTPLTSVSVVLPVPEDPVPRSLVRHDPEKLKNAFAILLS